MATEEGTLERELERSARPRALRAAGGLRQGRPHHRRVDARGGGEGPGRRGGPKQATELLDWFEEPRPGARRLRTRRSTSGSPTASSTPRTTAWTATSRPATATASRSTGAARRARSATSPTPTSCATSSSFANALKDSGIEQGDVVGIFLPMIPEVVVAMLACARIGAPHNVVFGGFSPSRSRSAWSSPRPRR